MIRQWRLCSNEQEQNFQVIDDQGLPVCILHTVKCVSQAHWRNKRIPAKTLWQSVADDREQMNAVMIVAAPDLWLLMQRVAVALPGDLPGLIGEAKGLLVTHTRRLQP